MATGALGMCRFKWLIIRNGAQGQAMIPQEQKLSLAKEAGRKKNYAEAIQHINSFLAEDPDNAEACFMRGVAFYHLGNSEDARSDFARVLYQQPDHKYARQWLDKIDQERAPAASYAQTYEDEPSPASEYGQTAYPEYGFPVRAKPAPSIPKAFLWPFYLYFRPKVFFEHFAEPNAWVTTLCGWSMGFFIAIQRFSASHLIDDKYGYELFTEYSWEFYWFFFALMGVIGGGFQFVIAGWWYKFRISLCGVTKPDPYYARRVFVRTFQVCAIPTFFIVVWQSQTFNSPGEAWEDESFATAMTDLLITLTLFWSLYTSYRGIRVCFNSRRWPTVFWFVVLPFLTYGFFSFGYIYKALKTDFGPPVIAQPSVQNGELYSFSHPNNWEVTTEDAEGASDYMYVESLSGDAFVSLAVFDFAIDTKSMTQAVLEDYIEDTSGLKAVQFHRWGNHSGFGLQVDIPIEGELCRHTFFSSTSDNIGFAVVELCYKDLIEENKPGFELIRTTFQLKDAAR